MTRLDAVAREPAVATGHHARTSPLPRTHVDVDPHAIHDEVVLGPPVIPHHQPHRHPVRDLHPARADRLLLLHQHDRRAFARRVGSRIPSIGHRGSAIATVEAHAYGERPCDQQDQATGHHESAAPGPDAARRDPCP
jgi:hypothetical protein